jgi:uncharacterized protein (TIGR00369 family)
MPLIDDGKTPKQILFDETRKIHDTCLLCGSKNPTGLKLAFKLDADGSVLANFKPQIRLEGYKGYLHGGIIASLLDSAMANCLFARGVIGFTAELNIKYKSPVKCDRTLTVTAKITKAYPPLYYISAKVVQDNKITVTADAKFMESPLVKEEK